MGGYVALNTALLFPEKVDKIVTLGTKFNWDKSATLKEIGLLNPEKIAAKVPQFAEALKTEHHPNDWKVLLDKTAGLMQGLSDGQGLNETDFNQIQHQVKIGIGSVDNMVTYQESEAVAKALPKGKIQSLLDVPHPINKIDPQTLANYIIESL